MSGVVRSLGQIAAFAVGTAINGTYGGAIGSVLFGLLVPPNTPPVATTGVSDTLSEGAEPGTPMVKVYGLYPVKGKLIDCGIDPETGEPAGIETQIKKKKSGGFLGFGETTTKEQRQFLKAAFNLCEGVAYCEKILIDEGDNRGEYVAYDRYNEDDEEMPNPQEDPEGWRAFLVSQFDGTAPYRPGKGIQFTPQYAPDGTLMAELSETCRLYPGTEWQEPDTALAAIHGDQVCAYVGQSYVMWNHRRITGSSIDITYHMRSLVDNSREILKERFQVCGTPRERIKLTSLDKRIEGASIAQVEGVRELIEKLAALEFHDLLFLDGGFQDCSRINPATWVIEPQRLGARLVGESDEVQSPVAWSQKGARELITTLRLKYLNIDNDYEEDEVMAVRQVAGHDNELTLEFPIASRPVEMVRLVDVMMDELWAGNATETITLLQTEPRIAPGNLLIYDAGEGLGTRQLRLTKQPNSGLGGLLECEGVLYDAGVYGRHRIVDPAPKPRPTVVSYLTPDYALFDLPALARSELDTAQLYFSASGPATSPFAGAFFESDTFGEVTVTERAALGTLVGAIAFTEEECTDFQAVTIRVQFDTITPATCGEDAARDGANLLAINDIGGTLMLSFTTAVPVSGQPRQCDLSGVWPGRYGTELFRNVGDGARCCLLTDENGDPTPGLAAIPVPLAKVGLSKTYEVSALLDPSKTSGTQNVTAYGRSLRPPTVSDLTKSDDGAGGYNLDFSPRTRDWESVEASEETGEPLHETDPRNFLLILREEDNVPLFTQTYTFSSAATLPLRINLSAATLTSVYGSVPDTIRGILVHQGSYLRGDPREFDF